jgi:diguanylate cyclase (GGDEF)-like protein
LANDADASATGSQPETGVERRFDDLRRALEKIARSRQPETVPEAILDAIESALDPVAIGLWERSPGGRSFRLIAHRGFDVDLGAEFARFGRAHGNLSTEDLRAGRPIVLGLDEMDGPARQAYERLGVGALTTIPLIADDDPVGLLAIYHAARPEPADERDLGPGLAAQVAAALASAQMLSGLRTAAARLEAIGDLSARLNRMTSIEGIGEAIVAEADRLITHDTIRVYQVDQATRMCEPVAFQGEFAGIGRPSADQLRMRVGEGLTGWVAANNQTLRLADAAGDPRGRMVGEARQAESILLVPMAWESRVLGVIVVSTEGYDHFGAEDQRMLEVFAGYAAQSMVNVEAFAQVERQRHELANRLERQHLLLKVTERLLSTLDPAGVLDMIVDSLASLVQHDSLVVYRLDRKAGVRRVMLAHDVEQDLITAHEAPIEAGLNGWVVRTGDAILTNEAATDPRSIHIPGTGTDPESIIVCPLLADGVVVGTLNISRLGEDRVPFSQDEFELVRLFAAQASVALRNAETHGAVRLAAEHDALTGLRNHGAFQRDLGIAVERGGQLALLMLDLDDFKSFNDTRGHPAGDDLLVAIGAALRETVRGSDLVYRYGGDEFAMIVPGAGAGTAAEISARVGNAVTALTDAMGPRVTVSVGVALAPDDGTVKLQLIAVADRALYQAKPKGPRRRATDRPPAS